MVINLPTNFHCVLITTQCMKHLGNFGENSLEERIGLSHTFMHLWCSPTSHVLQISMSLGSNMSQLLTYEKKKKLSINVSNKKKSKYLHFPSRLQHEQVSTHPCPQHLHLHHSQVRILTLPHRHQLLQYVTERTLNYYNIDYNMITMSKNGHAKVNDLS